MVMHPLLRGCMEGGRGLGRGVFWGMLVMGVFKGYSPYMVADKVLEWD